MQPTTLTKWKRDCLETKYDYRDDTTPQGKAVRRLADRMLILIDSINSTLNVEILDPEEG